MHSDNFEIRFFYLLAKFKLGELPLNNLFVKIYKLIDYKAGKNDIYDKMKIINNLKKMHENVIQLDQTLQDIHDKLQIEISPLLNATS